MRYKIGDKFVHIKTGEEWEIVSIDTNTHHPYRIISNSEPAIVRNYASENHLKENFEQIFEPDEKALRKKEKFQQWMRSGT